MKKVFKIIGRVLLVIVLLFLIIRFSGMTVYKKVPENGINKSMYVDINGTKMWINIYGENKNNPVMLYLHGGPGSSTSEFDYAFLRKWADVYTVVTWDQRNTGKSYDKGQNDIVFTKDLFMTDGKELTEFILNYLHKDKLTILGHSWGSLYGANLVLEYPEYYDAFIGTGQVVDFDENEKRLYEAAVKWVGNDKDGLEILKKLNYDNGMSMEYALARNEIMDKYGYGMMKDGTDYNIVSALIFNPNYSLIDHFKLFTINNDAYMNFMNSEEFKNFSLFDRYDYEVPFYNINGDKDYQASYELASEYYEKVNAPYKKLYVMKDATHGLLESRSEEFSKIIHEISDIQKKID